MLLTPDLPKLLTVVGLGLLMGGNASGANLRPKTITAWTQYVHLTEGRIDRELGVGDKNRLEALLEASKDVIVTELNTLDEAGEDISVPGGLIHHWRGSILIPDVSLDQFLRVINDQRAKADYYDDVLESRVIEELDDGVRVFLKLKRSQAMVEVAYNTEYRVQFRQHSQNLVSSKSISTRIAEIIDVGKETEREKPEGNDRGFLWKLNAYWRYHQVDGAVLVECETLTLSRRIPPIVGIIIRPFVDKTARNSMMNTLESLRAQVLSQIPQEETLGLSTNNRRSPEKRNP